MRFVPAVLGLCVALVAGAAHAAEQGAVTLVEGSARLLRGATWYKLAAGVRVEDGDIVDAGERAQVQVEGAAGTFNLVGPGTLYFAPPGKAGPTVVFPSGWMKLAINAPGLRLDMPAFDVAATDATLVVHAQPAAAELFVEAGSAKLVEDAPRGGDGATRDAKRGEYWSKPANAAFATVPRAPKPFVDAMPRHFVDPLPALAAKLKGKPAPVADRDITYAEAEPWLAGRDRALFEKRFSGRLRDPAFRKAVEPHVARYPSWDRILHPEKYAPPPAS